MQIICLYYFLPFFIKSYILKENFVHIHFDLLVKYLLEECTDREKELVNGWKQASPENLKEFERLKEIWDNSRTILDAKEVDTDAAWERFKQLKNQKGRVVKPLKLVDLILTRRSLISIAASVIFIMGIAFIYRILVNPDEKIPAQVATMLIQSGLEPQRDTLPDGSIVVLNRNSWLSFPETFSDSIRRIEMEGEIFFSVKEDKQKPFVVHAGSTEIVVLGTSFNIKTKPAQTEVIVESGLVKVTQYQNQALLKAGKKAVIHSDDSSISVEDNKNLLHQYFRSRQFICDNTPLSELAIFLSEAFIEEVVVSNKKIGDMRITTTFNNNSLEEILSILEETMGVEATRKGDTIIIR